MDQVCFPGVSLLTFWLLKGLLCQIAQDFHVVSLKFNISFCFLPPFLPQQDDDNGLQAPTGGKGPVVSEPWRPLWETGSAIGVSLENRVSKDYKVRS